MQFDSLAAFFAMGGHGVYVWLSYGATLLALAGYTLSLRSARVRLMNELRWQTDTRTGQAPVQTEQK